MLFRTFFFFFFTRPCRPTECSKYVYIYLQMQSCCPSKRKGVRAKVQLWSLQIKNWVSREISLFSKYIVHNNCFVKQQAELSLFIYRCFPKSEYCKVQQMVNTQTETDCFLRKNCWIMSLTPGGGFHHPAVFDHLDHIFQKHAFISYILFLKPHIVNKNVTLSNKINYLISCTNST